MSNNDEHSQFPKNAHDRRSADNANNSAGNADPAQNDPRLTAYALGEMDAAERDAFEAEIRDNPAAQAAIADIRAVAGRIEAALAAEVVTQTVADRQYADQSAIEAPEQDWRAVCEEQAQRRRQENDQRRREQFRFPYFLVAGLAVACFAVLFFTVFKPDYAVTNKSEKNVHATATATSPQTIQANGKNYAAITLPHEPLSTILAIDGPASPPARASASPLPATGGKSQIDLLADGTLSGEIVSDDIVIMDKYTVTASRDGFALGSSMQSSGLQSSAPLMFASNGGGIGSSAQSTEGGIGVGGFMKYMPGVTLDGDEGEVAHVRVGGLDPKYAGFSMDGIALASPREGSPRANHFPGAESYSLPADNRFQRVADNPLSTFSIDVDSASYSNIRRIINGGRLPPRDAVRIEEMINYFSYAYEPPAAKSVAPFAAAMEVTDAPWNPEHKLVRIGIKGRELDNAARPPANLVFLIDVSGSMDQPNKLPLVKESMRMLVGKLRADDRIAIVTYSSSIDMALGSTPVAEKGKILDALDRLRASGGTNGGAGIQLAYEIARANFIKDGANRVILCTDGDFNIGVTDRGELTRMIEEKAKSGVFLTVLGYGMGNYKDATLQTLANKGNGNHGYIDTRDEARRLLAGQTLGTLVTIAKDVKLQVEFNPAQVAAYRLIGYENRMLAKEDFNNDKVDAGEIGAGHTVTALYEVVPASAKNDAEAALREAMDAAAAPPVDPLKYQTQTIVTYTPRPELGGELLTLKIRYKEPASDVSEKLEFTLPAKAVAFADASADFKFASAVAGFGMVLRNSQERGLATFDTVLAWAEAGVSAANDADGRRGEFMDLVRRAKQIAAR